MQGIDLSKPFAQPVRALDAFILYLEAQRTVMPETASEIDKVLPWLRQLAPQVHFETRDPLVAFAFGRLALDGRQRKTCIDALNTVHRITEAS